MTSCPAKNVTVLSRSRLALQISYLLFITSDCSRFYFIHGREQYPNYHGAARIILAETFSTVFPQVEGRAIFSNDSDRIFRWLYAVCTRRPPFYFGFYVKVLRMIHVHSRVDFRRPVIPACLENRRDIFSDSLRISRELPIMHQGDYPQIFHRPVNRPRTNFSGKPRTRVNTQLYMEKIRGVRTSSQTTHPVSHGIPVG